MEYLQAIVLAIIQGATEFLPVSSSAHLILPHALLGWPDQGVLFDATLHAGTLTAVIVHRRAELLGMATSVLRWRRDEDWKLAVCIVLATLPLVAVGPFVTDLVQTWRSAGLIATTTIFFGLLLYVSDRRALTHSNDLTSLSYAGALMIGTAQVLAVLPGTSRAGITITAALFLGLSRGHAASFSFLLAIPTILGAVVLSVTEYDVGTSYSVMSLGLGFIVAAVAAFIGLEWFIRAVDRIGMLPFVVYRVFLGGLLATIALTGLA